MKTQCLVLLSLAATGSCVNLRGAPLSEGSKIEPEYEYHKNILPALDTSTAQNVVEKLLPVANQASLQFFEPSKMQAAQGVLNQYLGMAGNAFKSSMAPLAKQAGIVEKEPIEQPEGAAGSMLQVADAEEKEEEKQEEKQEEPKVLSKKEKQKKETIEKLTQAQNGLLSFSKDVMGKLSQIPSMIPRSTEPLVDGLSAWQDQAEPGSMMQVSDSEDGEAQVQDDYYHPHDPLYGEKQGEKKEETKPISKQEKQQKETLKKFEQVQAGMKNFSKLFGGILSENLNKLPATNKDVLKNFFNGN